MTLARKENQVYEDRVYPLSLSEGLKDLTSTELSAKIANGELVHDYLPEVVDRFIAATCAYRSVYEDRCRLLDLLYGVREWAEKECDFELQVRITGEETERGEHLRGMLRSKKVSSAQLKELMSDLMRSNPKR